MKYKSTRGGVTNASFEDVLFAGYASDGGLFLPEELPNVGWRQWRGLNYKQIVYELARSFIDCEEIATHDLKAMIDKVYNNANFDHPDIAPVTKLSDGLHVLELSHGPTWAFKDYSLLLVGELLAYFLRKRERDVNILIATSGDTGSSAIHAVKGLEHINLWVLFPSNDRITQVQERQMTTVLDHNIRTFATDGDSDELDTALDHVFANSEFVKKHNVGSINSINWARILIQMVHWFYGYFRVMPEEATGEVLHVAVPTGACGNITAGTLCHKMGLPIKMVTCTTTTNDVVSRLVQTGTMKQKTVVPTLAKAVDISRPYNVERILYLLSDGGFVPRSYEYDLSSDLHSKLQTLFSSYHINDSQILDTIREVKKQHDYLICPHTALSMSYAKQTSKRPILAISTAAWYKFPEAIAAASIKPPDHLATKQLLNAKTKCKALGRTKTWDIDWSVQIMKEIEENS